MGQKNVSHTFADPQNPKLPLSCFRVRRGSTSTRQPLEISEHKVTGKDSDGKRIAENINMKADGKPVMAKLGNNRERSWLKLFVWRFRPGHQRV